MTGNNRTQGRIGWEIVDHTAWITIENPRKRNAMSAAMWRQLPEALATAAGNEQTRVIVIIGATGAFSAGADISELEDINSASVDGPTAVLSVRAERAILDCPLPTIALIDGPCIGGGCQLAAACDIRIAAPSARFGVTPAKLGVIYPQSSIQRLVGIVGPSAAKLLLYSADLVDAHRAHHMRLVDEVDQHAYERVKALAATIASRSGLTIAASKELVDMAQRGDSLAERTHHWEQLSANSGESAEGKAAFLERRTPAFRYRHEQVTTNDNA